MRKLIFLLLIPTPALAWWGFGGPDLMSNKAFRMSCPVEPKGGDPFQRTFAVDPALPKVGSKSSGLTPNHPLVTSIWNLAVTPIFYRIEEPYSRETLRIRPLLVYEIDRETKEVTYNGKPLLGCSFEKL